MNERALGWFSNLFIAISIETSKFAVSVRRDLFSVMSREFTAVLKYWFKVFATSLHPVIVFPTSTKEIFVVLTPLSERRGLTVFQKVYYQLFYLNQDY